MVRFVKYHGLGNDYLVLDAAALAGRDPSAIAVAICDRHRGVGADGILVDHSAGREFALRIFNPDGSVAEKSGNGLRIFARHLFDLGRVDAAPFTVRTLGGNATCRVLDAGARVVVDMGRVCFDSVLVPVTGERREAVDEVVAVGGREVRTCAVTLGNPHCVVLRARADADEARALGPLIERHPRFPARTNVQFLEVLDRANIRLEIWERGAGYTLASGSSSCAAAAAAHRLGLCDASVTAHMPGGALAVELRPVDPAGCVGAAYAARQTGPAVRVCDGVYYDLT